MTRTQFNLRVTPEQKTLFRQFCDKYNINLSQKFVELFFDFMKTQQNNKKNKKIIKQMVREHFKALAREEHKKVMHDIYFIRNTQRQLFVTSKASLINSRGKFINTGQNKKIISSAKKIYENFSDATKKLLKLEVKELENWVSPQYAYEQVKIMEIIERGLPYIQQKREVLERKEEKKETTLQ